MTDTSTNSNISLQRDTLMGIGIISVILFHMYTTLATHDLDCFSLGFIGVDIFIMASGYGLCRSYENNSIRMFYCRRLQKILPLYFLFVIFIQIINVLGNSFFSIQDMLEQFFAISFIKGKNVEWYVPSILILYLVFPFLYKSISKNCWAVLALACTFSMLFLSWKQWVLTWNCFISRIPVFIYGIIVYFHEKNGRSLLVPASIILLTTIMSHSFNTSVFLSAGTITAFALPYLSQILNSKHLTPPPHTQHSTQKRIITLQWIGTHSYPIYLSNALLISIFQNILPPFNNNLLIGIMVYLFSTILLASLFIGIDKLINNIISNI